MGWKILTIILYIVAELLMIFVLGKMIYDHVRGKKTTANVVESTDSGDSHIEDDDAKTLASSSDDVPDGDDHTNA